MLVVTVWLDIRPGRMGEFLPLIRGSRERSLADEPGCRRFDICLDPKEPDRCFLFEIYDDEAALEAHCETADFKLFMSESSALVVRREVRLLQLV